MSAVAVGGQESAAAGTADAGDWMGFRQSPSVRTRNGWLRLEPGAAGLRRQLGHLRYVHALAWRRLNPTDSEDEWGRTFIDFKNGRPASAGVVTSLLLERVPRLLNDLVGPDGRVNLVTALSADDSEVNPSRPLYGLAASLGEKIGRCDFRDRLLRKAAHKRLTDCGSGEERDSTVDGVYRAAADAGASHIAARRGIDNRVFLILDDFVTRGSTFADISRALRGTFPGASIHAAALAKHVWADTLRELGYAENDYNQHLPPATTT